MSRRDSTTAQRLLAAKLGINVSGDSADVAAARLLDVVAAEVGLEAPEPVSARQQEFGKSLGLQLTGETRRAASAKISDALHQKNLEQIERLGLSPGDRVVRTQSIEVDGVTHVLEQEFVVSSIHQSGRVFFKGGNGQGAWPTQLRKSPNTTL